MKSVGNGGFRGLVNENQKIRFIAVSASIPNVEDIGEWIGKVKTKVYA